MVNGIAQAPSAPIVEGGSKADQQTEDSGFMAMLAGLVASQPGLASQTSQSSECCATEPNPAEIAQAIEPEITVPSQPMTPEAASDQPGVAKTENKEVAEALQALTVQQTQTKALPEAAKPENEIAASLIAARLNPMGQNSQAGAVLLRMDDPSKNKEDVSDGHAKDIAASAIAGSKQPEQAPADAGTRIQVQWKPTETVTISASNGGFGENLQFANGNTRQSEPQDLSVGNTTQQAFGVEMKSQLGAESIIRQAETAPAQAQRMDPTLGEKMVSQVVREVTLHKLGENTTLSIRLDPPELGTLRISVTNQSGVLTTQLESSNAVVRGILETHLPALKDALANAGVEVSKFSVSAGLDFGQNAQRQQQAWQPARTAPAVEFNPQMQDMQPAIEAAIAGSQAQTASYSWLA